MRRARHLAGHVALCAGLCVATHLGADALAGTGQGEPVAAEVRQGQVRVYGLCPAEDSCSIDYRGTRQHGGTWVIRREQH